ncbi:hypothetical protein E2C01_044089 [Portunus trituberculatus]|uniref:Uncharacterized protein n=1 Tax=Portunus trituberculatus TaxID=210409 RepID=A0A5B7FY53_PORTR|nr:hypothetical protein [Portunus trituberculatus]
MDEARQWSEEVLQLTMVDTMGQGRGVNKVQGGKKNHHCLT